MLTEFRKSIDNILYERLASPLFGTFILSWSIWNWKIFYITIFVSETSLKDSKLNYIIANYMNKSYIIWYPLYSTIGILLIYPFLSVGAFWVNLKFNNWKIAIRNKEESKQLLSLEMSIQLRETIRTQDERFDKLLEKKEEEIKILTTEIDKLNEVLNSYDQQKGITTVPESKKSEYFKMYYQMKNNKALFDFFVNISSSLLNGYQLDNFTSEQSNFINYLLSSDVMNEIGTRVYKFTEKGKYFNTLLLEEKLNLT